MTVVGELSRHPRSAPDGYCLEPVGLTAIASGPRPIVSDRRAVYRELRTGVLDGGRGPAVDAGTGDSAR